MKEKLRELDLNLLVILDALLRCESVSQAAEELQMSQSAVSHSLKRLRMLFNDELFVRSREGMVPTPKANEISGYVTEIIRLARVTLLPSQSFDPKTSHRTLTMALGDAGDMTILPSLTRHLRETQTDIKVVSMQCSAEDAVALLGNGNLDLYLGMMSSLSSDLLCQKLYEDRLVIVASSKSKLRKEISFAEYSEAEHIMLQSRTRSSAKNVIVDLFERQGMPRKVKIETPHLAAVPMILEKDDQLIATMPLSLALYFKRYCDIRIVEPDFFLPKIEVSQYWHRRYNNDPFLLWIRRTMCTLFQNQELVFG